MPKVKIHIDPLMFNPIFLNEIFEDQNRIQIIYGGSSSGKSVSLAQRLVLDLLAGSRNYLVVRKIANTLRGSCFAECCKIVRSWQLEPKFFTVHESDMEISCINKKSANFRGLDDVEKLKSFTPRSGVLTDIWAEEATEMSEADLEQLDKRLRGITEGNKPKRITMSFNPILRSHWICKRFFTNWIEGVNLRRHDGVTILKTTYRDNRFLAPDDIKALDDTTDPYMRDVYRDGNWGTLGGVIFPNVRVADLFESGLFKQFDLYRHGLDFGFSNDPTAFNSMYYSRSQKTLYIFREWNALGCTNDQIAAELKQYVGNGETVVCDSAEPKSIAELNNCGLSARGAAKGKDSVKHGIQWLQQQQIVIDVRCQNSINDFSGYHWKKDKTGDSINIPSDAFGHHPDAVRYACEDLVFSAPEGLVFSAPSYAYATQEAAAQ